MFDLTMDDQNITPDLETMRNEALLGLREDANALRQKYLGGVHPERVTGYILKDLFGGFWSLSDGLPDDNPVKTALEAFVATGKKGFEIEAAFTDEEAIDLRDEALGKSMALFLINQAIEGFERAANTALIQATNETELETAKTQETAFRAQAVKQINEIIAGQ